MCQQIFLFTNLVFKLFYQIDMAVQTPCIYEGGQIYIIYLLFPTILVVTLVTLFFPSSVAFCFTGSSFFYYLASGGGCKLIVVLANIVFARIYT